jgi:hypothetical protein
MIRYAPLWFSFLGSLVFWILLGLLYVISYVLNNTCDLLPTDKSSSEQQPIASAVSSSLLQVPRPPALPCFYAASSPARRASSTSA